MGRPRSFDTAAAVTAARDVFWERGYDGASLPDLERATGLGRSSLYHAFGSKRGLFDAAVADYLGAVVRPRLAPLLDDPVPPGAVVDHFAALGAALRAAGPGGVRGCLLLGAAAVLDRSDTALAAVVDDYRAELCAALARGVGARYPHLDDGGRTDRARVLAALSTTCLLLARASPGESSATVETALRQLAAWDSGAG